MPQDKAHEQNYRQSLFPLNTACVEFLQVVHSKTPKEARTVRLHSESIKQLKDFLYFFVQKAAETKLKTLDAGKGIL